MSKRVSIKSKIKKSGGYTLLELLATITILGILTIIGISGVTKLITKSKTTQFEQQEKNVSMATESYLQANKQSMPKNIGDAVNVSLKDLFDSNYLTEEVTNTKDESCMKNSYVRVYKYSKSEYTYTPYLYCGNDEVPVEEVAPEPNITIKLTDESDESEKKVFSNVQAATMNVTIKGGEANKTEIAIDGYLFSISTKKSASDDYVEVYNSGTLSANREKTITLKKKISDYVSLTGSTYVKVKVVATNISGGTKTTEVSATSDGTGIYNDVDKPICSTISNQAKDESDWVNKAAVAVNKFRTISVDCLDGDGSGCLRPSFTISWPHNSEPNAEYSYIEIKDNNNNTENCRVRVNVDQVAPTLELKAYVATNTSLGHNDTNVLTAKKYIATDTDSPVTISAKSYSNVQGVTWLNNDYYPYGIVYTIDATDNLHLYRWTWQTNDSYITDTNASNYTDVKQTNPEATSGYFKTKDLNIYDNGTENEQITFGFITEGKRYGILTVYDRADNYTQFIIKADIDRTAPPVPDATYATTLGAYQEATWTNKAVTSTLISSYKRDNLSRNGEITLSGWDRFEYQIRYHGVSEDSNPSLTGAVTNSYTLKNNSAFEGRDKIRWRNCDKANNCSAYNKDFNVYIDVTAPMCHVNSYKDGSSYYNHDWVNNGHYVLVKAVCDDNNYSAGKNSGCVSTASKPSTFSYEYRTNINVSNAGAQGVNYSGKVYDIAGNVTTCAADQTVKVDIEAPKCTKSGDNYSWTNRTVSIKWGCVDSGSGMSSTQSGCNPSYSGGANIYNSSYTVTTTWYMPTYTIKDIAGNSTTCPGSTRSVYYETIPPSCTSSGDNYSWTERSITLKWGCSDNESGCNASSGTKSRTFSSSTITWTMPSYQIRDVAGNSTTCQSKVRGVYIDKDNPSCTVHKGNLETTGGVSLSISCSDNTSGVTDCPSGRTGVKTGTYSYTIHDAYGHSARCSTTVNSKVQRRKRTRSWNSCKTGSKCAYYKYSGWSFSNSWTFFYSSANPCNSSSGTYSKTNCSKDASKCRCAKYTRTKSCVNTCAGGWNDWSGWSGWSDSTGACWTDSCQTEARTVYY